MAKKKRKSYMCQECGHREPKWLGRCPECSAWSSFEEYEESNLKVTAERAVARGKLSDVGHSVPLTEVPKKDAERIQFGIHELDRVLGGGLVPGSLVLLGGDPGIGKSTLSLEAAFQFAAQDHHVLYVSGEESLQQTRMRAERTEVMHPLISLLAEVDIEQIQKEVQRAKPKLLIIDSIQSVYCPDVSSTPGSVNQIRESSARLLHLAKRESLPIIMIGHVTKGGVIAGPKLLEHMVDTVLYFEGERGHPYRILRAVKNRFGSTNEIGVFEMKEEGLVEVGNPSKLFLEQRPVDAPGSVVTICMEGTRPLLVEVQALVGSPAYGTPRRTCTGVDHNRVAMLVAVLEKSGGLQISSADIFVNVAGGFRLDEPAADLAIIAALASSFRGVAIPQRLAIFGEVGLSGEIRGVSQSDARTTEARKLGFSEIVLPQNNRARMLNEDLEGLIGFRHVGQALSFLFPRENEGK